MSSALPESAFVFSVIVAFIGTLILSLLLPYFVRPLIVRLGIMDIPNERSSHERPILRGMGLAVLIAMACGGSIVTAIDLVARPGEPGWMYLFVLGAGSLIAGLVGLREDFNGLSVLARSCWLLGIGIVSSAVLLWAGTSYRGSTGFGWVLGLDVTAVPWWVLILLAIYGMLFVSSYINVANFMDGLNGISGFHGVVAGLAFAAAGWLCGFNWLVFAGLVLAAGFGGFLPWNLTKPGAFLGDVGSYLLGGSVAIVSFAAFVAGVPLLAAIGPMVIYFGDVAVTLVKRVRAGHKWDEPHKEHVYQRIQQLGYSHVAASGMAAGCTAVASLLGLVSCFTNWIGTGILLVCGLAVLVVYLQLPRILSRR